jgi:hypothetical protein
MEYKEVIEHYNNGQDKWEIGDIISDCTQCIVYIGKSESVIRMNIGFYEWLFNPKYKVFEVFKVSPKYFMGFIQHKGIWHMGVKQPQEILTYLKNQTKGDV